MPIISFPSAPSVNDTYSFNGKTWVFTGQGWNLATSGSINDVPIGNVTPATGNFTTVGATGNITTNQFFIGNGSQLTGITASGTLTVSNVAPVSPSAGDVWIAANTGVQFVYFSSGGNSQWAEMEADVSFSSTGGSSANIDLTAVASNIIPAANITYDIGNTSNRFRDIYLANSTIYLGDATISANGSNVVMGSAIIGNITNDSTGYMGLPVGNTAQRPVAPTAGMIRFNTSTNSPEWYDPIGNQWLNLSQGPQYNIEYLVIAGGGGGGSNFTAYDAGGGGGGAGGYRSSVQGESSGGGGNAESVLTVSSGVYTVTIGAGGAGAVTNAGGKGSNGSNSVFGSITSAGGGGGGSGGNGPTGSDFAAGASGGSGGGSTTYSTGTKSGGSGTANQGYNGGASVLPDYAGAGGGGAGAVGASNSGAAGGFGGNGVSSAINGTATTRAGGGGGGYRSGSGSNGGTGGGGAGGAMPGGNGTAGTQNTGGGGGGASGSPSNGALGGSGIVIIRYAGAQRGSGGTITSAGGYTIHTFTSSGTYTA